MILPPWLAQASGAMQFANNPANGFQPTLGDGLQGIGHSMAEHYRRGMTPSGSQAPGVPGGAPPQGQQQQQQLPGVAQARQLLGPMAAPPQAPPVTAFPQGVNLGNLGNLLFR